MIILSRSVTESKKNNNTCSKLEVMLIIGGYYNCIYIYSIL